MDIDYDPFSTNTAGITISKMHIHVQQQGRRQITVITDFAYDLDTRRICADMRKLFSCNGTVSKDDNAVDMIRLQGDHREKVREWLIREKIMPSPEMIVVHGA